MSSRGEFVNAEVVPGSTWSELAQGIKRRRIEEVRCKHMYRCINWWAYSTVPPKDASLTWEEVPTSLARTSLTRLPQEWPASLACPGPEPKRARLQVLLETSFPLASGLVPPLRAHSRCGWATWWTSVSLVSWSLSPLLLPVGTPCWPCFGDSPPWDPTEQHNWRLRRCFTPK